VEEGWRVCRAGRGVQWDENFGYNLACRRACCFHESICASGVENYSIGSIQGSVPRRLGKVPSPSKLYANVRQLPLCLRVRHSVSIVLVPVERTLASGSSSSSLPATGGRRKDWTCPPESPTARMGSLGWRACVKSSEESGRVQRFSNISVVKA
jgi:hypothetical protein